MRPLMRRVQALKSKKGSDVFVLTFVETTPLNWRDIIAIEYDHKSPTFCHQRYIFKDGSEYEAQTHLTGILTDKEELEAKDYLLTLDPGVKDKVIELE